MLAAAFVLLSALLLVFRTGAPEPDPTLSANTRTRPADHRPETHEAMEPETGKRVLKVRDRGDVLLRPRRSKGELLREASQVFGQAEAARTTKLTERFGTEAGNYLYVVEQPSDGEIQHVKALIADLRNEVALEERENFDERLQKEIKSYDPYGEQERKAFLLTVPTEGAKRMSGMIMNAGNIDEFRDKLLNNEPVQIKVRQFFVASYDDTTLERFAQVVEWEPGETE